MPRIFIFACVHNAGRSQMAAAFFNHLANPQSMKAASAGTSPADRIHPAVLEVMREVGIDLSRAHPQKFTPDMGKDASALITMGCGEECPYIPGVRVEDWKLEDPKDKPLDHVRRIRDEIRSRVEKLIQQESVISPAL